MQKFVPLMFAIWQWFLFITWNEKTEPVHYEDSESFNKANAGWILQVHVGKVMYKNATSKKDEQGMESRETCNEPSQTEV